MSRLLLVLMTAVAVVVLPQVLLADDGQPPTRPRPEMLFKRLDANGDGQVAAEEIPERAPESFKAMLKRADGNEDGKITAEEFAASVKQPHHGSAARPRRPAPTTAGSRRPGPPHRTSASGPRRPGPPRGPTAGPPRGEMPSRTQSRMGRGAWAQGIGGARPRLPDPKAMFERLDRDKDGKLSLGEFTLGMPRLHPPGRPPFAGPARPPMPGRGPVPGRTPMARPMGLLAAEAFKRADADKDGKLTLDEVPSDRREGFKRLLKHADKDGDKALSPEEARRVAAMTARARTAMAGRAGAARRPVDARKAAEARRAAAAGRAAAATRPTEARKRAAAAQRAPAARKAAPAAKRPPTDRTPEARKQAAEAKKAAAKRAAQARKKQADAGKRAPDAEKRRARKAETR